MIQPNKALKLDAGQKEVKVIETVKGELKSQEAVNGFKAIMFREILSPVVLQNHINMPINMQTLKFHANNPRSLENTSLTPGLIEHDLQVLTQLGNFSHGQILILDGSNYQSKVAEVFDKYTVIKGYNYRLEGADTKSVLLSYDHILKQIQYQFKLGNGKYKPGFIGQILVSQALNNSPYREAFKAYLAFSSKNGCPVLINCLQLGELPTYVKNGDSNKQFENKWRQIKEVIAIIEAYKEAKVVLFNLPLELIFNYRTHQDCVQEVVCLSHQQFLNILTSTQIYLAFDLNKYAVLPQSINYLSMLCSLHSSRIIFSGGITYKTELTTFGGGGFRSFTPNHQSSILEKIRSIIRDEAVIRRVMVDNKWALVDWKIKLEEIEVMATWECDKCGASNTVKFEAFRKFGKQFCSIKCLKAYNF